ncbi:conserved exported protein of unknown function [Rhodovastum atsumiense]|uniref:Uncharacterized protein n=1 Tax=Rhodovastum atsumiense TaxID=504468 RepID=A0A5M6IW77_9PROT|nr:hypothetical protein [Rhodovastum atsumiense]KAA5612077.1 hypothetical protein F1189_11510 [Rhodovastum atsumiense]CAH2604051.1 conserved exported protein of unknown function [Rhodovastum atsumiense]
MPLLLSRLPGLLRRCILAILVLGSAPALAADAVLLASTAPGYLPGMAIAAADRLALPEGASVTLLFRSGQMLRLRGPFEGALEQVQPQVGKASVPALAQLFRLRGVDASVIGGTRATGGVDMATPPQDVAVDPQRPAVYCLGPSDAVWIRRPVPEGASYVLRRHVGGRRLVFPAGADRIEWPADLPIEDGDRFELLVDGAVRVSFSFRMLPPRHGSVAAWVAAGVLAGCHEQFDAALRRLAREAVPQAE